MTCRLPAVLSALLALHASASFVDTHEEDTDNSRDELLVRNTNDLTEEEAGALLPSDYKAQHWQAGPSSWRALMKSSEASASKVKVPKHIWAYWEQGNWETSAPELNRLCLQKWKELNPGWKVHILTKDDVAKLAPELSELWETMPGAWLQIRSDLLRQVLLAKFGGVWVDASLLPLRPLDSFVHRLVAKSGFFCLTYPSKLDPYHHWAPRQKGQKHFKKSLVGSNYFLISEPGNPLVVAWRDTLWKNWVKTSGHLPNYGSGVTPLNDVVRNNGDPHLVQAWEEMPRISSYWIYQCGSFNNGCDDFWRLTKPEERPPVLKRPYGCHDCKKGSGLPPDSWMKDYLASLPSTPSALEVTRSSKRKHTKARSLVSLARKRVGKRKHAKSRFTQRAPFEHYENQQPLAPPHTKVMRTERR